MKLVKKIKLHYLGYFKKPNLWLLLIALTAGLTLGIINYLSYEPTTNNNKYVEGNILRLNQGRTGKSTADPHYWVRLNSGLEVKVRSWAELPYNYTGKIILEEQRGDITGKITYRVDKKRTLKIINSD